MELSEKELADRINGVILEAKKYIRQYAGTDRLKVYTEEHTQVLTQDELRQAIDPDKRDHPYDDPKIRHAIGEILKAKLQDIPASKEGESRHITYLSGAYGSRGVLRELLKDPQTPELIAIKERLDNSLHWNFDELKHLLNDTAGVSLKRSNSDPSPNGYQQYPMWRGLLSGIDVTLGDIATNHHLNFATDNSLAPINEETRVYVRKDLARDGQHDLQIVAVALTPAAAAQAAMDQNAGVMPEEAASSARKFHEFWPELKAQAKNITLLDESGKVIYQQIDGRQTVKDSVAMAAWEAGFIQMERGIPLRNPQQAPRTGRSR